MKKIITTILVSSICLGVTACTKWPDKEEMEDYIEEQVQDEDIREIDYDKKSDIIEMEYESRDRDLTFHVYGHPAGLKYSNTSSSVDDIKTPKISTDYAEKVHELYYEDVEKILDSHSELKVIHCDEKQGSLERYNIYFDDPDEIPLVVDTVNQLNELWREELKYHDEEWLQKNKLIFIGINYNVGEYSGYLWTTMSIDGAENSDELTSSLDKLVYDSLHVEETSWYKKEHQG